MAKLTNQEQAKTQEEINAEVDALDESSDDTEEKAEETAEEETSEEQTTEEDAEETGEEESETEEADQEAEEEEKEAPKLPKDKKSTQTAEDRYKASTVEAQILHSRTKKFEDSVISASEMPEPTEEEMVHEYPDWEDMTKTEQTLARKAVKSDRRFASIQTVVLEGKQVTEWAGKVDKFVDDAVTMGTFPDLKGKEAEFRTFVMKPSRRGLEFEDLTKAFLYDVKPEPKKTGALLQVGGGGEKQKADALSADDVATLRVNDHKQYQRLVKAGKIKIDI